MAEPPIVLEGIWEEVKVRWLEMIARSPELAGRRWRVTILDTVEETDETEKTEELPNTPTP